MNLSRSLSVIVVNHNNRGLLAKCLDSIYKTLDQLKAEIILVDNDSMDGSVPMVQARFPHVQVISNRANLGYAAAVNQAIRSSTGEYFLILNADTQLRPNSVQALSSFLEDNPHAGMVGPKLIYPDGRLQHSCRTFYTFKTILLRRTVLGKLFPNSRTLQDHLMLRWAHDGVREVDWVVGAAMMVRRAAVDEVGPMDERYFLYLEDVDWCYRMHLAGWRVYYVPQAEMIHHYRQGSRSESMWNRDTLIHLISMLRYYEKWARVLYSLKRMANVMKTPTLIMVDLIGILWAFWLAAYLMGLPMTTASGSWGALSFYFGPVTAFSFVTVCVFYLMGLYKGKRNWLWVDRLFLITKCVLISSLMTGVVLLLFPLLMQGAEIPSKWTLIGFVGLTLLLIGLLRQGISLASRWLWGHRFHLKRVLIVGNDENAVSLKERLLQSPELGYDLVGLVAAKKNPGPRAGFQLPGKTGDLVDLCERERVREVIFVNIQGYYESAIRSFIRCRKKLIDVRVVSEEFESAAIDSRIRDFSGFAAIDFECRPSYYVGLGIKRIIDMGISLACLVVLSPLILFVITRLRWRGGSAFFVQQRVGKDGKAFSMYKFRTMIPGAENQKKNLNNIATHGPLFKVRNDPRVTRFGRFLRTYNLDEIPQFINVLKGEMSVVGPRPPLAEEVSHYEEWHKSRLEVMPGITGLWQVDRQRKWRFDEMVKLDIFYILNWSLLLDMKILLRTLFAVVGKSELEG
jgi:exopolysaccharide biosynthesis polyprenyl glycosylphosphotransferase